MYLNKALIFGNLTRDPELRSLPSGAPVTSFAVATNRVWKDKNGVKQESVDYHNVVVFGRQAEIVSQYLRKGSSAFGGRTHPEQKLGRNRRTEKIPDGNSCRQGPVRTLWRQKKGEATGETKESKPGNKKEEIDTIEYPEEDINPEDIPF